MRLLFFVSLFICCVLPAIAQRTVTEVDLTVNGIHAGSKLAVVKRLGKPMRKKSIGFNDCAEGYQNTYYFPGLEVGVINSKNGKFTAVISLNITSKRWRIAPNIHLGASKKKIISTYGKPVESDATKLTYVTKGNTGWVGFTFRKGKLIRVTMEETLC